MEITPDFSALGLVLTVPLIGYVLVEGLVGKRTYDRMLQDRDRDPAALARMLRVWIALSWAATAVAVAVLAVSPGTAAADLGLRPPDDPSATISLLVAAGLGLLFAGLFLGWNARRGKPLQGAITEMHPRTPTERAWMLGMAVTAGICEEVVYRGFLIAVGVGVLGLDVKVAAGLALALFVLGHAYQGWRGMFPVAAAGFGLTYLYLSTGSLLAAVAVHIAIDVLALVVVPMFTARPETPAAKAVS
ncbi:CPBP family intramembrane metalloprotease [Actinomadura sp. GC306]|uniref:CPBP family intramembrane glutamic endopeptidase n=1 Tax=Actinomadura sp. GC306 TaxID=2530367 RepID=UPI00104B9238|nr:CPBP family intramembrane glutamic endopeptidase [Actinomadura sp. GC306]TDC65299.1 CPBP family intramembrane metalloprotease [Actinomadura sp. GC306]